MPDKNLIVLLGPTAVGKTDLSINIANNFKAEIISADSRQFYKGLEIGTASPDKETLSKIKHHFIGNLDITSKYDIFEYEKDVIALLKNLFSHNDNTILTGGSGMYIDAVCKGVDDLPDADKDIREQLEKQLKEDGIESLRIQLRKLDPEYYKIVDISNPVRLIRGIEVCLITGVTYSSLRYGKSKPRDFKIITIGLNRNRDELYERINSRVDQMIKNGLLEEAEKNYEFRNCNALKTVGYKEIFEYLDKKITLEKAIEKIKTNTRRYAKRQMTWFNRDKSINWFHPDNYNEIIEFISNKI